MARLTAAARRALPDSAFAGPNRTFPVQDAGHAQAALGRLHNAPKKAQAKIHRRAEAVLHKHSHAGHQAAHAAQHDIQVHGAPMVEESKLRGHAGDTGPAESHDGYREHHELHKDAHPGAGFAGREGSKRHFRKSMKTNRFM